MPAPRSPRTTNVNAPASTGSAQRLVPPDVDRLVLVVRNDGAVDVRAGGPTVTPTTGLTLQTGGTGILTLDRYKGELWFISEGAASALEILEVYE